jgi:carbamoyltransferase
MNILGLTIGHNSSAALMIEGKLIGLIQEERLTGRKNQVALPLQAIKRLLAEHLNNDVAKLDHIVYASKMSDPYYVALDRYSRFDVQDHVREMHEYWHPYFYGGSLPDNYYDDDSYFKDQLLRGNFINHGHNFDLSFLGKMKWKEAIDHFSFVERSAALKRTLGWSGPADSLDHHLCHAYYALYGATLATAQHDNVLVLTADSFGDDGLNWSACSLNPDGTLCRLAAGNENAVARLYKFTTLILGMKPNEHEFKVMGLAGYSHSSRHIRKVEDIFFSALDFRNGTFVSETPLKDSYFDLRQRLEGHRFDNIAAGLQNWATQVTKSWVGHWLNETGATTLCFSGGLAMNIRINGELLNLPEVSVLSVPASGADESTSAGACLGFFAERCGRRPAYMDSPYLGEDAGVGHAWRSACSDLNLDYTDLECIDGVDARALATILAANGIVARCDGKAEFGARSLGNRAILANPANPANTKIINDAIKSRDFWMPFAPSILEEYASEIIRNPKNCFSPYMTVGFDSTQEGRLKFAAATHAGDFTMRPQMVRRSDNPGYWEILEEFRKLTGVPGLLNTSLNLHGEPMNYSVSDAVRTLLLSGLQFLSIPNGHLIFKKSSSDWLYNVLQRAS